MVRREMHRFRPVFRESREQRRNGSMHFPDGEPPVHIVMRHALDTGKRAEEVMQTCGFRLFANREFDDVFGAERCDQLARRAERDHFSVVHNRHAIAEPRSFFHVVSGQQHRASARLESFHDLPRLMARLRIEAGRWLVQEKQFRITSQCAREGETLLLSSRQRSDVGGSFFLESYEHEQLRDVEAARVKAAEQNHDLADAQLVGKFRLLELNAQTRTQRQPVAAPGFAEHLDQTGIGDSQAFEDFDRGRFAGSVRTEHSEALSAPHFEIEAGDGHGVGVALYQIFAAEGVLGIRHGLHPHRAAWRSIDSTKSS